MYCQDFAYFHLLTAEEQFQDIKEYWLDNEDNQDEKFKETFKYLLKAPSRDETQMSNDADRTSEALNHNRAIFNQQQKADLKYLGSTIVTIIEWDSDDFEQWCKDNSFRVELVAAHCHGFDDYRIWPKGE